MHAILALSPLDGRYRAKVAALAAHFSEFALIRHRVRIEIAWLSALADEPGIAEVPPFSTPRPARELDARRRRLSRWPMRCASRRSSAPPTTTSRRSSTG